MAGLDKLAGGSWLGLNDHGLVAGIMNRTGSLGPAHGKRSRGELVLEALDHADAREAGAALAELDPRAYRPFNLILADSRDALWIRSDGGEIRSAPIPAGLSMLTAHELNDETGSRRIGHFLPQFRAAPVPEPAPAGQGGGDWRAWQSLMASRDHSPGGTRHDAMTIVGENGFGTLSSALIALPQPAPGAKAILLFAAGPPDRTAYRRLAL